jgi:myo-inositol catabolism protein IolC
VVAAARQGGRDSVGCIILDRGQDDKKLHEWLAKAAGVPGFIGFAVGRTDFWQPLVDWRASKITREEAGAVVSRRYTEFVSIFRAGKPREREGKIEGGSGAVKLAQLFCDRIANFH